MRSRTIREGSVGLLILLGLALFGGIAVWLRGIEFGKRSYNMMVTFDNANGMVVGAPVRYRGFKVGKITSVEPQVNGVDVVIEIADSELRIPKDIIIEANQSGLIGETTIDIVPQSQLQETLQSVSPIDPDCNKDLIVCENDRLKGQIGVSLDAVLRTTAKFTELYTDPEFFKNINATTYNASQAAAEIAKLSKELSLLSSSVRQEVKTFAQTANSVNKAVEQTSSELAKTAEQYNKTAEQLNQLASNVDGLVSENRDNLAQTLNNLVDTSKQLNTLLVTLSPTIETINTTLDSGNTEQIFQNLETLTANAATASANLRNISETLNAPTNVLVLQQTLDSARATFENAQKITADLDELTGDPAFRSNLIDLVNGLSNLVSSTEQLEQQIQTAQSLKSQKEMETAESLKTKDSNTNKINDEDKLVSDGDPDRMNDE